MLSLTTSLPISTPSRRFSGSARATASSGAAVFPLVWFHGNYVVSDCDRMRRGVSSQSIDAKSIGALVAKYSGTFLLSTPTFCANYVKKLLEGGVRLLRLVMAGAEKLREPVAKAFQEKFGLELFEGYGCTEMAVICANGPDSSGQGHAAEQQARDGGNGLSPELP